MINRNIFALFAIILLTASAQECTSSVKIISYGFESGNTFELFENGNQANIIPGRGVNIATYLHGFRTGYTRFDTHASTVNADAMANYIYSQPPGTRFALGCMDECISQMNNNGWDALEFLGLDPSYKNSLLYRGAFTLVGHANADYDEQNQDLANRPDAVAESETCVFSNMDQFCYDYLEDLSADADSVDNICDWESAGDDIVYNFQVDYVNGFVFDENCIEHTLDFQGQNLPEGNNDWEYQFDGTTITFSIPHLDLEGAQCVKITEPEEYIWQCFMSLHIWYQGTEQYQYDFHMTTTLSRVYENELNITVEKNEVVGECCENELNIVTDIAFCTDFTCAQYYPTSSLEVERKGDIFVEHFIVSEQFKYYYLHPVSLTLGPFVPHILARNGNQAGRLIYKFKSNIAMDSMVIEAVSRIDESSSGTLRRRLQSDEQVGEDYKVKALSGEIKIQEATEKKHEQIHEELNERTGLVAAIVVISIVLVALYSGVAVHYLKNKKQSQNQSVEEQQQPKYRTQRSNSIDSQV